MRAALFFLLGLMSAVAAPCPLTADPGTADATSNRPWRLDDALGSPDRFRWSGEQRTRYQALANQFRPGLEENDQALALRTLVRLDVDLGDVTIVGEVQDSRAYLTDVRSGISTIVVNTGALLQAYVNLRLDDVVRPGSSLDLRFGRQTLDLGSRRLIARNRFRNTIQNYNGVSADWQGANGGRLVAFFFLPVQVRPRSLERRRLVDNDFEFDEEDLDLQFWAVFHSRPLGAGVLGEAYVFGLHEEDDAFELATSNRRLYTPGVRIVRDPEPGRWDFDVETTVQFGRRRATPLPSDTTDLDVFALFQHGSVGYTFDTAWRPRVSAEVDYATGEGDPDDGSWNRYDSLFGPRRAEFGPTDIYGILGRENILSAGLRIGAKPSDRWDGYVSWRANFLDEKTDFFARSFLRDPAGTSGRFAGHQIEFRSRLWLIPGSLRWEIGGAWFRQGEFMETAPRATGLGDPLYGYTDLSFRF